MSYVTEILSGGEKVVYQAKISLWNFVSMFAAIVLLLVGLPVVSQMGGGMGTLYILFVIALCAARIAVVYYCTELALTDHRLIYKTGFISRYTNEINYKRIESIQVSQSIMGRLLNFGTIRVGGVGTDGILVRGIAAPLAFRKAFGDIAGKGSAL